MTARAKAGFFQKMLGWVVGVAERPTRDPNPSHEEPLLKLPRLIVAIATRDGRSGGGVQLMVDSLNLEHITCKSREFLEEGNRYELALLLQGVGHVKVTAEVDWVLLSSYGHSAGLRLVHSEETRDQIGKYVRLIQEGARG
jgi:hypothetical protein